MENKSHFGGSFTVSGTPFDPFSREERADRKNARIMPSIFIDPGTSVKFTLLRNVVPDEDSADRFF